MVDLQESKFTFIILVKSSSATAAVLSSSPIGPKASSSSWPNLWPFTGPLLNTLYVGLGSPFQDISLSFIQRTCLTESRALTVLCK